MDQFVLICLFCLFPVVGSAFAPTPAISYDHKFDKKDFSTYYDDENCCEETGAIKKEMEMMEVLSILNAYILST